MSENVGMSAAEDTAAARCGIAIWDLMKKGALAAHISGTNPSATLPAAALLAASALLGVYEDDPALAAWVKEQAAQVLGEEFHRARVEEYGAALAAIRAGVA